MADIERSIKEFITDPTVMTSWVVMVMLCLGVLIWDMTRSNSHLMSLMKWVWMLTVLYSGPIGLAVYWFSGRKQIARDSLWRKGFRSVAHCYSGCGMGEIVGVIIAAGLLALTNWPVAGITFLLAYAFGFALTAGPLMQDGEPMRRALWDAFASESASITVMEIAAICVDLWLAGNAKIHESLFWSSLVVSLCIGLLAAYPVNLVLIHYGIKSGMHDPINTHHSHGDDQHEHQHQHEHNQPSGHAAAQHRDTQTVTQS